MWKTHKKTVILTFIITLLPMIVGIVLWDRLPEMMATHWGMDNEPNGWMSKPMAVFGLPLICAALLALCVFATDKDKRSGNITAKAKTLVLWVIPLITWVCAAITYGYALEWEMNIGLIACVLIGVLFIVLGNQMPKQQSNRTFGIRTKLTLSDEDVWRASHRFGGWVFTIGGLVVIVTAFLSWWWMALVVLAIVAVLSLCYPRWYYNKREKNK